MPTTRRQFLRDTALLAATAAASPLFPRLRAATPDSVNPKSPIQNPKSPNLLFIFPDQMRRHAMAFTHEDPVITPRLDRFATQSLYLPNNTSTFPLSSPFRGTMMTGRFPNATHVNDNCTPNNPDVYLRRAERCITDVLHDAGYHIGYIGKWHLTYPPKAASTKTGHRGSSWDAYTPPEDRHHIDYWHVSHSYGSDVTHLTYWDTDTPPDGGVPCDEWSPQYEATRAIAYLENAGNKLRDPAKPFALWVSMTPPHPPYDQSPERYRALYKNKTPADLLNRPNVQLEGQGKAATDAALGYFSAVTGVDDQFGRILDTLDRLNLADNTIVVFTSDHGDMMGSHALMGKQQPYEESVNTPFLIRWPRRIKANSTDDLLLSTPDLMPTLLGLMNLHPKIPEQVQGADYSPIFLGLNDGAQRPAYAPYLDGAGTEGRRGVRTHTHTLTLAKPAAAKPAKPGKAGKPAKPAYPAVTLYDNRADPYQLRNIAAENPDIVAALTAHTHAWLTRAADPWTP